MHVNEQLIRESSARLRKAERNVQLARQFSCTHPRAIVASAAKESFGKKLARAVKARTALRATTRKQHEEQAQRELNRYRKPERRQRTKSD
jgi:hypothetical protein